MSNESKQSSPIGDADYLEFLRNERNKFAKIIQHHFPHEGKPLTTKDADRWTSVRVAAEDILICFDQMRERIAGAQWQASQPTPRWVKGLSSVLKECNDYLNQETFVKGKPQHLNSIGAYSVLHQKIKTALLMIQSEQPANNGNY